MKKKSPGWKDFAEAYNNITAFPSLNDVAAGLGLAYNTVKNKAKILRNLSRQGHDVPKIITRGTLRAGAIDEEPTPHEHARIRAQNLENEVLSLLQRSRYPIINPEAIVVNSHMSRSYSRRSGTYELHESTPRTWLSDTLRVSPVKDCRNRRFIFTGAQNDATVHEEFWENLHAYARLIGAEIIVGPWTYETQWWSENNPLARAYDDRLSDYLCFGQLEVGDQFVFCGEMNTLPTANRPISDLVTYSRGRWAVFPHAKLQLKSVPSTDPNQQAHQVMTTGACTHPQVIPRKAGVKSIFHHVIGATIVEFDADGDIFCRQINAIEDGSFYDLDVYVSEGVVSVGARAKAMICGDIHVRKLDPRNGEAVFGAQDGSMLSTLRPENLFLHDIHDHESRNHHHVGDNAYSYEMAYRGRDNVIEEVRDAAAFLVEVDRPITQIYVIESNHDLALERYVREGRYRNDGVNVRIGLQLEDAYLAWREKVADALDQNQKPPSFSLLEHAIRTQFGVAVEHVKWIHDSQSYILDGVECGHHGFRGANGARGTVVGFARIGRKMSIGDKHSPEILDGVYVAGVMQLQMGYNKGPSSWAVSNIVHYPNGKRTLVTLQNGKWRAPCKALDDLRAAKVDARAKISTSPVQGARKQSMSRMAQG
jgi:hypothetical protein